MQTIWKERIYPNMGGLMLPKDAQVLTVAMQRDEPHIWFKCDDEAKCELRHFVIYGTGHQLDDCELKFIGTFFIENLVFHLFEKLT